MDTKLFGRNDNFMRNNFDAEWIGRANHWQRMELDDGERRTKPTTRIVAWISFQLKIAPSFRVTMYTCFVILRLVSIDKLSVMRL